MTRTLEARPLCLFCGKRLRRIWHHVYDENGTKPRVPRPRPEEHDGRPVLLSKRVEKGEGGWASHWRVWCGTYGDGGYFCTGTCAIRFAFVCARSDIRITRRATP